MEIILTAVDKELASAWREFCGHYEFVRVHEGSIFDLEVDAVVSPANSFGFMDGGIDLLYSRFFGWDLQNELRKIISEHHGGELVVGNAEIVETGHEKLPFLIAAPTMRVPMILRDSVNPYLAARAVFRLVMSGVFPTGSFAGQRVDGHVKSIALPGLGTGVGQIGANTCAHQVAQAIGDVILGNIVPPRTWAEAMERHQLLYTDRTRNLQFED